jgi:hypothetical protein
MQRISGLEQLGWVTFVVVIGLAVAPRANAAEAAEQCFQMTPYLATLRIMRITSDYSPGMQALFAKWRLGSFQMLGTGVRAASVTPAMKDIVISFMTREAGDQYRLTALFDPTTSSGSWSLYSVVAQAGHGTLTKIACDSVESLEGLATAQEQAVDRPLVTP